MSSDLERRVVAYVTSGEGNFDELALAVWDEQQRTCAAHREVRKALGEPTVLTTHTDIPPVAVDLMRYRRFYPDGQEPGVTFLTSGTTSGRRGAHHMRDVVLYHRCCRSQLRRFWQPDGVARPALFIATPPSSAPNSSLGSMLGLIGDELSARDATFAWEGEGPDIERAIDWLTRDWDRPVQLLATTFGLVAVLDAMVHRELEVTLPPGSIVMPTGGAKGRSRQVSNAELAELLESRLGLRDDQLVAEYGMTELSSQFWEPTLALANESLSPGDRRLLESVEAPVYVGPPFCRAVALDPVTGELLPDGHEGMLTFTDLGNLHSAVRIQTADLGTIIGSLSDGSTVLRLTGRAPGARLRGCSLVVEEGMS